MANSNSVQSSLHNGQSTLLDILVYQKLPQLHSNLARWTLSESIKRLQEILLKYRITDTFFNKYSSSVFHDGFILVQSILNWFDYLHRCNGTNGTADGLVEAKSKEIKVLVILMRLHIQVYLKRLQAQNKKCQSVTFNPVCRSSQRSRTRLMPYTACIKNSKGKSGGEVSYPWRAPVITPCRKNKLVNMLNSCVSTASSIESCIDGMIGLPQGYNPLARTNSLLDNFLRLHIEASPYVDSYVVSALDSYFHQFRISLSNNSTNIDVSTLDTLLISIEYILITVKSPEVGESVAILIDHFHSLELIIRKVVETSPILNYYTAGLTRQERIENIMQEILNIIEGNKCRAPIFQSAPADEFLNYRLWNKLSVIRSAIELFHAAASNRCCRCGNLLSEESNFIILAACQHLYCIDHYGVLRQEEEDYCIANCDLRSYYYTTWHDFAAAAAGVYPPLDQYDGRPGAE